MDNFYYIEKLHHHSHQSLANLLLPNFLMSETFWVAFGSFATASALIYTMLKHSYDKKQSINNIKLALQTELMMNINMLFSGEVERRSLFDVMKIIRKKYVHDIKNQDIFFKIQRLYSNLDYYNLFVDKVYLTGTVQNGEKFVTEKQLQTCNSFLEFFGEKPIDYDEKFITTNTVHGAYIDKMRDLAIEVKNREIDNWEKNISKNIENMFK